MNNYYDKYIKYKSKYMFLQHGGDPYRLKTLIIELFRLYNEIKINKKPITNSQEHDIKTK